MQLFKVIVPGQGWNPQYYPNKAEAKKARNHEINRGGHAMVCRGPDHWRGPSDGTSTQTKSSKRIEW